jgi:hypothetical protein
LLHTSGTLGELQHLLVDMMLLEPAVQRAKLTLKPVMEITRMSRQLKSQPTNSLTAGDAGEQEASETSTPTTNTKVKNTISNNSQTSWMEILEGTVAWCQQTVK